MTPDPTLEERQAAAELLCRFSPVSPAELLKSYAGSWESFLIDKQCALTRCEKQVAEARELLKEARAMQTRPITRGAWYEGVDTWLEATK